MHMMLNDGRRCRKKEKKGKSGGKLTVDNLVNNSFFQAWAIIMTLYGQLKNKWKRRRKLVVSIFVTFSFND